MFETEGLPDEPYVNATGDKTLYDNLNHIHTMDKDESYQFIYDARAMMDDFVERVGARETKLMMTEAYASLANTVRWYGHNDTVKGAHMPFNFALIAGLDKDSKATDFKNATDGWMKAMPANTNANWVIGNHDRPRVGTRYGPERHESLAIMTMMLPGINVRYLRDFQMLKSLIYHFFLIRSFTTVKKF
jgi:alpha-glucosidase